MTPLALSGPITTLAGFQLERKVVLRLMPPTAVPTMRYSDAALVDTEVDLEVALLTGWQTLVLKSGVTSHNLNSNAIRVVVLNRQADYIRTNDVVAFDLQQRRYRTLFRAESSHNSFLVTERCNHLCLMCSQPPKNRDDSWLLEEIEEALALLPPDVPSLGFTGGEPLIQWKRFVGVLRRARMHLPDAEIHVLSNGRFFAKAEIAKAWAELGDTKLCVGIPIYSSSDHVHDYVVQSRGALDETLLGILRLKELGQRVEIRLVLHALTTPTLVETCSWFSRSLPFVDHVALMGLENTGFAIANDALLWQDPVDYMSELSAAVRVLSAAGMRFSIYNLPRCLLSEECRPFAAKSISDWKNGFPLQCDPCAVKAECGGFFTTGRPRLSRGIAPIRNPICE
jgi:His-Xaa-Ser system radical SAM maturase HxsC